MKIYHIIKIVIFAVSGVIFSERSHQDHRDEADKEDHHHETVEDTEPVNLKSPDELK